MVKLIADNALGILQAALNLAGCAKVLPDDRTCASYKLHVRPACWHAAHASWAPARHLSASVVNSMQHPGCLQWLSCGVLFSNSTAADRLSSFISYEHAALAEVSNVLACGLVWHLGIRSAEGLNLVMHVQMMLESCIAKLAAYGPLELGLTYISGLLDGDLIGGAQQKVLMHKVCLSSLPWLLV